MTRPPRACPPLTYDPQLPIVAVRAEIAAAIAQHPVVVVCGETGSGKSTQLPKICLELGRGQERLIGHTQPRRIAARSVAARLAEELSCSVGGAVGFKIRFTDVTGPATSVKLMTDGILLAETQGDRWLEQYDTLIIDEAHERSLNIDFLLGYVKRLLPQRPDLRVIITSATIDAARFSEHFASAAGPAPILSVSGRSYPVDVWYRPPHASEDDDEPDRVQAVLDAVDELLAYDRGGDILVFLATERDILDVSRALRGRLLSGSAKCEILPLYARLSTAEQNRVFQPHAGRRIVLATNVAESSLTVPGIRFVVDTGLARISRYAPRSKIQRLPIEPISQASADQRKGRCGRLGPGVCVRLYSEDDYLGRDRFTQPEIRRSNLAAVILQAEALQLGALEEFPFLDPPSLPLIRDGYQTLFELGAVDEQHELTPLGRQLSRLPVDPRIGRMLLAAQDEGCLHDMLIIAAALEVRDPRERPAEQQQEADAAHARFAHPDSDFLTYVQLWSFYQRLKQELSRNRLRRACHQNFLSPTRMREWQDVHLQLQQLVTGGLLAADGPARRGSADRDGRDYRSGSPAYAAIHRALLTGLLSNVALKTDTGEYRGAEQGKLAIWPGSAVVARKPLWIVAGELLETHRRYARVVARIQPEWLERLATHLVQRSYSDPTWNPRSGSAVAWEKVSLFGLPIVARRQVGYGAIDPEFSRELLIRHGLVGGELRTKPEFLRQNERACAEWDRWMTRTRRAELRVDEYSLFGFYNRRLPADVYDEARLNRWRKEVEREDASRLLLKLSDIAPTVEPPRVEDYPEQWRCGKLSLPLEYRYEPGCEDDGVTLVTPRAALGLLMAGQLDWLIPGRVAEKVEALIRGLPKSVRRQLIPANEVARRALAQLRFGEGDFFAALAVVLTRLASERVTREMLQAVELDGHLCMNIRVVDEAGQTLGMGRDLGALRQSWGDQGQAVEPGMGANSSWQRDGITRWDFGTLPESVERRSAGVVVPAYPTLIDQGRTVSLRLWDQREAAEVELRAGVRRLALLYEQRAIAAHVDWFPQLKQLSVQLAPVCSPAEFREALALLIVDRAYLVDGRLPRSDDDFQLLLRGGRSRVEVAVQELATWIPSLAVHYHAVRLALEQGSRLPPEAVEDLRLQVADLMGKGFLLSTPAAWLEHLPRYLHAMRIRLQKIQAGGAGRDRQLQAEIAPWVQRYREFRAALPKQGGWSADGVVFRWWLEELRVSLFAQQLGTSVPISVKRLQQQWERLRV
ncbi:MAG: ATP-dependent RNA helicase HrpA [Pirellulales bacterium]